MKTIIKTVTAATILLNLTLLNFSCKKQVGPQGPAGPAGANGISIKTSVLSTNSGNWTFDNSFNTYNLVINSTDITQSVVDNGTIQVFFKQGTSTDWTALPYTGGLLQYNYSFSVGKANVWCWMSDGTQPPLPGNNTFKLVVIPPALIKKQLPINDMTANESLKISQ